MGEEVPNARQQASSLPWSGGGGLLLAVKVKRARGQLAAKTYRVGWLQPGPIPDPWVKGFRQGLQEFNYVEGKNLKGDYDDSDRDARHRRSRCRGSGSQFGQTR